MSLQNQQNFLARLYTNAELRRDFLSEPEKIGAENCLNEREIAEIAEIMPEELNFFADSLFWKRLRETEKFLPLTKMALGEDYARYFREFAQNFNPQTVKKHFEDALGLTDFLQNQSLKKLWAKDLIKFERARLILNSETGNSVFAKFDHDIRFIIAAISNGDFHPDTDFPKKMTFAVWLKIGKKTKHFIW